jgi:signal transduction histidine kinase/ligand-binding sensor domain-containing protein
MNTSAARARIGLALLAQLATVAGPARAAEDDDAMPSVQERWSRWYTIRRLAQTEDGYLWIATSQGLVRFDGARFVTLALPAGSGASSVAGIAVSPRGTLFAALVDGRLAYVTGGALGVVGGGAIIKGEGAALAVDASDQVWLGSDAGLYRWRAGAGRAERVLANRVYGLAVVGQLFSATDRGLLRYDGSGFRTVGPARGLTGLAADSHGGLWTLAGAGRDRSVDRVLPEGATEHTALPSSDDVDFTALAVDDDGTQWVVGSDVLLRVREGGVSRRALGFRPPALLADREGSIWIGSVSGVLARVAPPWARVVGFEEESGPVVALSVLAADDGSVWSASDPGLTHVEGASVLRLGRAELPALRCPRGLAQDGRGDVWVSTCEGQVLRLRGGQLEVFGRAQGLPRSGLGNIEVDAAGTVWAGARDAGLFALRDGRFVRQPGVDAPIRCLLAGRAGGVWVGTRGQGLLRVADGNVQHLGEADGLRHGYVNALLERADGTLWVGTRGGGLYQLASGRFRALGDGSPFPTENVNGLIEDGREDLWVSSDAGLYRLPRANRLAAVRYGSEDGFATERFSDGFNAPAARTRDGRLWFPTNFGVAAIRAPERDRPRPAPRPIVEEVLLGGAIHAVAGGTSLRALADSGEVAFRFTAPTFSRPQRLKTLQYRLEGRDAAWLDASTERVARYVGLRPGRYTFRVRAVTGADPEPVETGAALQLILERPLREWSYLPLGAGVAVVLAFAVQRVRVRQMRRRFDAVLAERNRIARDLHDSLAQGFAGIGYQLDHLEQSLGGAGQEARKAVTDLRTLVRLGRLEARQAIGNLRGEGADTRPLSQRLRESAQQAQLSGGAAVEVTVDGDERVLAREVDQELARVAQEATTNALVHGRARRVLVELAFRAREVRLMVNDDGAGFDPAEVPRRQTQHFGLAGMKERAARIGGTLDIASAVGQGTTVTLTVPERA